MIRAAESVGSGRYQHQRLLDTTELHEVSLAIDTATQARVVIKAARRGVCQANQHTWLCHNLATEKRILRDMRAAGARVPRPLAGFHLHGQAHLVISYIPASRC